MKTYIKPAIKVVDAEIVCLGPGASDACDPTVGAKSFFMEIDEEDEPTSSDKSVWDD